MGGRLCHWPNRFAGNARRLPITLVLHHEAADLNFLPGGGVRPGSRGSDISFRAVSSVILYQHIKVSTGVPTSKEQTVIHALFDHDSRVSSAIIPFAPANVPGNRQEQRGEQQHLTESTP